MESSTTSSLTNNPIIETIEKPTIVQEIVRPTETVEIQPVIHREVDQTEVHRIVQPIHETEVLPTFVQHGSSYDSYQQSNLPTVERVYREPMVIETQKYVVVEGQQPLTQQPLNQQPLNPPNQLPMMISGAQAPVQPFGGNFHLRVLETRAVSLGSKDTRLMLAAKLKGFRHMFSGKDKGTESRWTQESPHWNQDFVLHPTRISDIVQIRLVNQKFPHTLFAKAEIPISEVCNKGIIDTWLPLRAKKSANYLGDIHVMVNYGQNSVPFPAFPSSISTGSTLSKGLEKKSVLPITTTAVPAVVEKSVIPINSDSIVETKVTETIVEGNALHGSANPQSNITAI